MSLLKQGSVRVHISRLKQILKARMTLVMELFEDIAARKWHPCEIRQGGILMIEPNAYHGEILPGIFSCLEKAGWHVDLFIRHKNDKADPFCQCPKKPEIYPCSPFLMKRRLKKKEIEKYEYIFLTSDFFFERGFVNKNYWDWLGFMPSGKCGTLIMLHRTDEANVKKIRNIMNDKVRVFSLREHPEIPMLCPVFFGFRPLNRKHRKGPEPRRILIAGWKPRDVWKKFYQAARVFLSANPKACRFYIVGRFYPPEIPEDLRESMEFLFDLPFRDFYRLTSEMDYILAMLDPSSEEQRHYLHGVTSGIRQLSIGMNVPLILEERFAEEYGFTCQNAVIYRENILDGLLKTIQQDEQEYDRIIEGLSLLENEIDSQSLRNLKEVISAPELRTIGNRK